MPVQISTNIKLDPIKAFQANINKAIGVKIGILGSTDARDDGEPLGNAGIGVVQEYGSITNNIPARSFLRMPLEMKKDQLNAVFEKTSVKEILLKGDIKGAFKKLGVEAEAIIDDAFKSGGFGTWPKNAPSTVAQKKSSKPLIDTSELRRSITSQVVERS